MASSRLILPQGTIDLRCCTGLELPLSSSETSLEVALNLIIFTSFGSNKTKCNVIMLKLEKTTC